MLVDPFTVAAQIVNFLILVVVLKFLLYDRIIAAMDTRQEAIAEQFSRAQRREEEADRAARRHRQELRQLHDERDRRLQDAEEQAEQRREELVAQARRDVVRLEERWVAAVEQERQRLLDQLRSGTAERVLGITRSVLADLADERLEERIISVFVDRLAAADEGALHGAAGEAVEVRTAFALDDRDRDRLATVVRTCVDADGEVRFSRDQELLGGIEVYVDGHALGWNIDAYLDEVEDSLRGLLQEEADQR